MKFHASHMSMEVHAPSLSTKLLLLHQLYSNLQSLLLMKSHLPLHMEVHPPIKAHASLTFMEAHVPSPHMIFLLLRQLYRSLPLLPSMKSHPFHLLMEVHLFSMVHASLTSMEIHVPNPLFLNTIAPSPLRYRPPPVPKLHPHYHLHTL